MYAKIFFMTAAILLSGQAYAQTVTPSATSVKNTNKKKKKAINAATTAAVTTTPASTTTTASPLEVKKEESTLKVEAKPEEPTLTSSQKVIKYMKEKFSASYHGEYYFNRRLPFFEDSTNAEERELQDFNVMHSPTIVYKPTKNWQMLATAEFKYTDRDNYISYPNTFFRSLFTLTRKNILTEKDNGVQLDAGIGRRQFNTGLAVASYGNNRVFTTISKTFNKHSGSLFVQYLGNDYKKSSSTTWKHGVEIIPTLTFQITEKFSWLINDDIVINTAKYNNTPRSYYMTHDMNIGYFNYQWNDKVSTYYQLKYLHLRYDFTKDYRSDLEDFEHYMGVSYAFTNKITLTTEVGGEVARASDGRSFLSKKIKYPEFAMYLDISL